MLGRNLTVTPTNISFDVWFYNKYIGRFVLNCHGEYNAKNALCAIAVALLHEVEISTIYSALKEFKGVKRRLEKIGKINDIPIICDYAHHPTEIRSCIESARKIYRRILCVFQPHTFSRTQAFFDDFVGVLKMSDEIFLFKTFPARENESQGKNAKDLYMEIKKTQKSCRYFEDVAKLKKAVKNLNKSHVTLVLGAGDLYDYF